MLSRAGNAHFGLNLHFKRHQKPSSYEVVLEEKYIIALNMATTTVTTRILKHNCLLPVI